jgi:tyrosinase
MYQAAHPDRFFSPQNVGTNGNVFIEEGANVDADTELLPFRAPDGGFWTSRKVMDTRVLGYVYPETANVSTAEEGAKVAAGMYGSSVRERLGAEQFGEVMSANKTFTDWTIRVEAKLAGTFVVRFTLVGDFSSDELVDVGSWVKMRPMSGAGMGEEWVSGSVSLSSSLLDQVEAGRLGSLDKADVVPYLKDKLTWDVFKVSPSTPLFS